MIEVKIKIKDAPDHVRRHPSAHEAYCNSKLKEAGVPVLGFFTARSVSEGVLEVLEDRDNCDYHFRWYPPNAEKSS